MGYVYIAPAILLTVYGQAILSCQATAHGPTPAQVGEGVAFPLGLLLTPRIMR
jgi:hypothetical protein